MSFFFQHLKNVQFSSALHNFRWEICEFFLCIYRSLAAFMNFSLPMILSIYDVPWCDFYLCILLVLISFLDLCVFSFHQLEKFPPIISDIILTHSPPQIISETIYIYCRHCLILSHKALRICLFYFFVF